MMTDVYRLREESDLGRRLSDDSLLRYYSNMYSECGQDGILKEIFARCGLERGLYVEFGAWDGCHLSNCRALTLRGWNGISIECDETRYQSLRRVIPPGSIAIHGRIGTSNGRVEGTALMELLNAHAIAPDKVTFVSIDVDGSDLEIFDDLRFSPPVVLVEGGFNYQPGITKRAEFSYASRNNQHPLGAVLECAKRQGYRAVCFFQDTYLVREDFAHLFSAQISLGAVGLYRDAWSFASDELRKYLIDFRLTDKYLKEFEFNELGYFDPDPTALRLR
jgi:hypothetical protein